MLRIRVRSDPFVFRGTVLGVLDPDPDPTLMSTTEIIRMENVTTNACCLAPCGPTDMKNKVKIYINKNYRFRYITSFQQ